MMKRACVLLVLLSLTFPPLAWAQTPVPDSVILTNVATTNQNVQDGEEEQFSEDDPPTSGLTDVYEIEGEIENFKVSDPINLRTMFSGAVAPMTPLTIQRNSRPLSEKLIVSGQGRICTYKYGELEKEEETGVYYTEEVPELSETLQLTYQLGPMIGDKFGYKPNDSGIYNFDQFQTLLIDGKPPPCDEDLEGTDTENVETRLANGGGFLGFFSAVGFSLQELLANLFSQSEGKFASHQTGTYYEAAERYTVSQQKGDVGYLSYLPEVQAETEEAGGAINTYFPASVQTYTEEEPEGAQPNFQFHDNSVDTNDFAAHLMQEAAIKMGCMILPKTLQSKFFEEGKCQVDVEIAAPSSCQAMIESWETTDASCKACNTSSLNSTQDPNWVNIPGGDLPPSFKKIVEKAADSYRVPASVILGTIYHEGAFTRPQIQWTEENVINWSCGEEARMPFCDENATTAQLPAGWFPSYFDAGEGYQAAWNAVSVVDPTRNSRETTSVCNFMDVIFATAKNLSLSSSRVTGDAAVHNVTQCYNWPLTNRTTPQTCSAWNENIVAQSQVNYGGYCPEPGKHTPGYPYVDNALFIDQTISFYNRFSCGR